MGVQDDIMTMERECVIRGYHLYKDVWTPTIGEILECRAQPGNRFDRYSVSVLKDAGTIVGHHQESCHVYFHYL